MDIIQLSILHEIDRFRLKTFSSYIKFRKTGEATSRPGIQIWLQPTSDARPLYDGQRKWIGFDRYFIDYMEMEKPVKVCTDRHGKVKILHLDKWVRVSKFLQNMDPQEELFPAATTARDWWDYQWDWWVENKKRFRFLMLPSEIRDSIYLHTLGTTVEPYPHTRLRQQRQTSLATPSRTMRCGLFKVNRQVSREADHIAYLYSTFLVRHRRALTQLLQDVGRRGRIRHVSISLSHKEFLKLFGWRFFEDGASTNSTEATKAHYIWKKARHLHHMTLSSLVLDIAPPSRTTDSDVFDGACQKVAVDWILEAAWPWVKGQPVKITGSVSLQQKLAFEAQCLVEQNQVDAWRTKAGNLGLGRGTVGEYYDWVDEDEGGVPLDGPRPVADVTAGQDSDDGIFGRLVRMKPECVCNPPCTKESWTAVH